MKKMMKRLLGLALCALLVLGMAPVYASAAVPPPVIPPVEDTYENDPATCTHENGRLYMVYPNYTGRSHTFVWSCCGGTVVEGHAREQIGEPVPPTCTDYGYTMYYCNVCGEYFEDDINQSLEHTPVETGVKQPGCTDMGYEYYVCEVCGVTVITKAMSSTGHMPGQLLQVVEATCEQDGYTSYSCATCGETYADDVTSATGHSFLVNSFCMNCGLDKSTSILITMTQKWEDGWGHNGITVWEDGVEIGTATVEYGKGFAQWSCQMDPQKDYRFYWNEGQSAKACAFTISVMGEEVFCAEYGDCENFSDGQMLYPFCAHSYVPTEVTPPTCHSYGYTTYTCTLCGTGYDGDLVDPTHSYDDGVVVPPSCTEGGYTIYTCAYCHNSYSTDLTEPAHDFDGLGTCIQCGVSEKVQVKGFTLSFEDEIQVNMYYTVSDTAFVKDQGVLMFRENPGTDRYDAADAVYTGKYDPASGRYSVTTGGIAAREMGDDRYYCVYILLSDGTYAYSPLYQYSPKKYAVNMLGKDTASAKQKALCVAMLNYGAAAQGYFGYRTDALMNAGLTAEQKALVVDYDACRFRGAVAADPGKTGVFTNAYGFDRKGASVSFEGAFSINYYFQPSYAVAGNLTMYVWDADAYGNAAQLTFANAAQVITASQADAGTYCATVRGIAAKAVDETIYVAAVYTNADGETCCSGVVAYSLSAYCMRNASNATMGALAQATAVYGYYADIYFA